MISNRKSKKHQKKSSLKEKENRAHSNGNNNKSLEIEEWSDGDEQIRAKNAENKALREKAAKEDMNTSDSSGSGNLRKRKTLDEGMALIIMITKKNQKKT